MLDCWQGFILYLGKGDFPFNYSFPPWMIPDFIWVERAIPNRNLVAGEVPSTGVSWLVGLKLKIKCHKSRLDGASTAATHLLPSYTQVIDLHFISGQCWEHFFRLDGEPVYYMWQDNWFTSFSFLTPTTQTNSQSVSWNSSSIWKGPMGLWNNSSKDYKILINWGQSVSLSLPALQTWNQDAGSTFLW